MHQVLSTYDIIVVVPMNRSISAVFPRLRIASCCIRRDISFIYLLTYLWCITHTRMTNVHSNVPVVVLRSYYTSEQTSFAYTSSSFQIRYMNLKSISLLNSHKCQHRKEHQQNQGQLSNQHQLMRA